MPELHEVEDDIDAFRAQIHDKAEELGFSEFAVKVLYPTIDQKGLWDALIADLRRKHLPKDLAEDAMLAGILFTRMVEAIDTTAQAALVPDAGEDN
jgi:hypothetical protein